MRWMAIAASVLFITVPVWAQKKPNKPNNSKVRLDDQIEQMLRQQFDRIDTNKDGDIDPEEAAKFFRGPNAKPAPELLNKATRPGGNPFDDKNLIEPPKPEDKPADKPSPKPATKPVAKPMDVLFFETLDTNGDGKVSWPEFSSYFTQTYAQQIEEYQKVVQQMRQLQQRMLQSGRGRLPQLEREFRRLQQQHRNELERLRRLTSEMHRLQQQVQQIKRR